MRMLVLVTRAMLVVALAATGAAAGAWRQTVGAPGVGDTAWAVVTDGANDVVTAGVLDGHFAVVKLAAGDGHELWERRIDGTANGLDRAFAVAVDAAGDVLAAGTLSNAGTDLDFTVVKLAGGDGHELWCYVIDGTGSSEIPDYHITSPAASRSMPVATCWRLGISRTRRAAPTSPS